MDVWQLALEYVDIVHEIARQLPRHEEYNRKSQIIRAATSIALNIAEGSTGQTDAEQARFLGLALRSLIETIACRRLIIRRRYLEDMTVLNKANHQAEVLAAKLHTFRKAIAPDQRWLREPTAEYVMDDSEHE